MDDLTRFLLAEARRPFSWRDRNCLYLGADWLMSIGFPDAAEPWRSLIDGPLSASRMLRRSGGVSGLMVSALGPPSNDTNAVRGDLGAIVVLGPRGRTEVCGICTGARWAARSPRGLWLGAAAAEAIWRV